MQLSTKIKDKNSIIYQTQDRIRDLEALVSELKEENTSLELACSHNDQFTDELESLNLNGQCLFDNQFSCSNQLLINSSNYPPLQELSKGIYFIQLNVDGNLQTVKIIKQ